MSKRSEPQDFASVLMQHAKGRAHAEASRRLAEVVEAVMDTGKQGSITIKLTISPDKDGERLVKIADAITAKAPQESRKSLWFPDDDGNLHRNNPNQQSMFSEPKSEQAERA